MRFSIITYAKIMIYAIKNKSVWEYIDLKKQKDLDKKKSNRKKEYFKNEITPETLIKEQFPMQENDKNVLEDLEKQIDEFIKSQQTKKYPSKENPYPVSFGLGKNVGRLLYCLVKKTQPDLIVETGVANGFSSAYLLLALNSIDKGKLISIDYLFMPWHTRQMVGRAIPKKLMNRHELIFGKAMLEIKKLIKKYPKFDFFIHDSSHVYKHMMDEYEIAWDQIKDGGYLLSDDISQNDAFLDFADKVSRKPIVVRKSEENHFGIIQK